MTDSPPARWRELIDGGHLPRFGFLCLGLWLHAASSMLVATTLPRAVIDIGGHQLIGWAFSLYQLGSIVAGAASALLVAKFGLRGAMIVAACVYAGGCLASAMSPDMPVMLVGRTLSGLGGGALLAINYIALNHLFPRALMPYLIAVTSAVWSTAAFCGPLIGGGFATLGLWRYAFWAFALQAALFIIVAVRLSLPETGSPSAQRFPALRLAMLAAAILLVSLAGADVDMVASPAYALTGIVLLMVMLRLDANAGETRLFPPQIVRPDTPLGAGFLMIFMASAATMSFLVYGPLLLDVLHAIDPLTAGYVVAMESIGWGIAALVFAGTRADYERYLIRAGVALVCTTVAGFAFAMRGGELTVLIALAVLQGAGFGMMWGFVIRRMISLASDIDQTRTSAALPTTQQTGFAMGAAACGIVANAAGFGDGVSLPAAGAVAVWIFAAFVPFALLANVAAWRLTGRGAS